MTNKRSSGESSSRVDRKTVERNRRVHMKSLCSKLVSLVPSSHFKTSKDMLSLHNQITHVISYIKELKERVEKLQEKKKEAAMGMEEEEGRTNMGVGVVEIKELGSIIEVVVISGVKKTFSLYQLISVVEEEGGQVLNASFSTVGDKVYHSLHVEATISRVGVETSRVRERLQKLVS